MASPKGPAEFQRCRLRLVLVVLLVLLHGLDEVPPCQHFIKVGHQVLIITEIQVLLPYIRVYRTLS